MQIILMRHAEPDMDMRVKVTATEYGAWLKEYARVTIKPGNMHDASMQVLPARPGWVVCSDLVRSIDTARALGIEQIDVSDPLFREFEMPCFDAPWPSLTGASWTVLLRLLWMLGYSRRVESFRAARQRTEVCADRLIEYAQQYGIVLLVGHGSMLWYLVRELRRRGWQGPARAPRQYGESGVYCAPKARA